MKQPIQIQQLARPQSSNFEVTRKRLENYSYGLEDLIGRGYSSQVFRGSNDLTGHPVAIKVIDLRKLTDKVLQDMVMSEVSNLRGLRGCRNILQLEQVYSTRNNIYIITELCEGGDLVRVIQERNCSEQKAAEIMEQLLQGYIQVFRRKIVHRDIKPANVFLHEKTMKIADFGFSVLADKIRQPCSYNVGSPMYMAPQVLTHNHYSFKSDIWALGIIYYELLFGMRPWVARDEKQLTDKINCQPIITLIPKTISRTSMAFLQGTLNPDVTKRISPEELSRYTNMSHLNEKSEKYKMHIRSNVRTISFKENSRNISMNMLYNPVNKRVKIITPTASNNSANISIVYAKREPVIVRRDNSKILLSELHFCRFLAKVATRLQSFQSVPNTNVIEHIVGLIHHNLLRVQTCQKINVFALDGFELYQETNDFQRIISVAKQYVAKYTETFGVQSATWVLDYGSLVEDIKTYIRQLYQFIKQKQFEFTGEECQNHLWLLDRMVTLCKLIKLSMSSSVEEFSRLSNIETIVQSAIERCLELQVIEKQLRILNIE